MPNYPGAISLSRLVLGILLVVATVAPALSQTTTSATALDRFAGTWREDESRRQIGSMRHLIFRRSTAGFLEEERGSEARPTVQPVIFGGKPYKIESVNTIAWKQIDASRFERAIFGPAGLINTRRIGISLDGKTLTEAVDQKTNDGRPVTNTVVYQRMSGDAGGLVGRWKPLSVKSTRPAEVRFERAGNALKFSDDIGGGYTLTLDDKPVAVNGLAVIAGSMIAATMADERTIETTSSRLGVVTARGTRTVSSDGKMLTVTVLNVGPNASTEPSVTVYVKQ
jgi:hypothetical protein